MGIENGPLRLQFRFQRRRSNQLKNTHQQNKKQLETFSIHGKKQEELKILCRVLSISITAVKYYHTTNSN